MKAFEIQQFGIENLSLVERDYILKGGAQLQEDREGSGTASLAYLLRERKVLGLVAGFFAYNYCFYLLVYWMPSYFSALHLSKLASIVYTSVPWLVATATDVMIGGWLVDVLVRRGHDGTVVRQSILIGGTVLGLALAGAVLRTMLLWRCFGLLSVWAGFLLLRLWGGPSRRSLRLVTASERLAVSSTSEINSQGSAPRS